MDKKIGRMPAKPTTLPPDVENALEDAPKGVRLTAAIASRFRFEPRINGMTNAKWLVAVDRDTGKTYRTKDTKTGRKVNVTFRNSHEGINFLMTKFELKGKKLVEITRFTL